MKLYIKTIVIEKDGVITESVRFNKTLSVISGSTEMYDIIKLLLGKQEAARGFCNTRFLAVAELDKVYYIRGSKSKDEPVFTVAVYSDDRECTEDYFEAVRQTQEMDSSLFFHRFKRQDYPHKLFRYRDLYKYYPDEDFAARTNGYGTTRCFRSFITNYIKHFEPIQLRGNKDYFLKLSNAGKFYVSYLDGDETVCLSGSENILYHYYSFLSIADFWSKAEKIRNLNRVNKPLVISRFLELLDDSIDLSEIVHRANKIDRQIIAFSEKQVNHTLLLNQDGELVG